MPNNVRVMTIVSDESGNFTILSRGLSGSVQYYKDQIDFLRESLAFLEDDAKRRREKDEEFRSTSL